MSSLPFSAQIETLWVVPAGMVLVVCVLNTLPTLLTIMVVVIGAYMAITSEPNVPKAMNCEQTNQSPTFVQRMQSVLKGEWTVVPNEAQLDVRTRPITMSDGKVVTAYRFEVHREQLSVETVVETLAKPENWQRIDPNIVRVTESRQTKGVFQMETRRVTVVSPRVGYVSFHSERAETCSYVGFMGALAHDFEPTDTTKATIWVDGTMVEATKTGCRCVYVLAMDPNLWWSMPHTVAIKIVTARIQNMEGLLNGWTTPKNPPEALYECATNHAGWRSVSHDDGITMWQGTAMTKGIQIRGSMIINAQPRLLQKLVSLPSMQYELMQWVVRSDTTQTRQGVRHTDEQWRVPSPYVGLTTRSHSVRHFEAQDMDDRIVVAMATTPSDDHTLQMGPSGWVINFLGEESSQCHVEFILQCSYTKMPSRDSMMTWGKRRVQQMLKQLRTLS